MSKHTDISVDIIAAIRGLARDSFPRRVFWLALLVRLVPVLLSINLGIGLDDMFQYDMLARSLAAGNGFRWYSQPDLNLIQPLIELDLSQIQYDPRGIETSFRPVLYPAFLALIYLVSGLERRFMAARLAQAVLGALLAPMTYALARRIFADDSRVARWSSLAIAVYPMLVLFPLALATENLFFVLILGAAMALLRAGETGKLRDFALAGVLIGLAILTRSVITAFVPLAALWGWRGARSKKGALILLACSLAVPLPWAIRNTLLHRKLTFTESAMGYSLYVSYHPQGSGSFQFGISLDLLKILDDKERDEKGTQAALAFIRADPARALLLIMRRAGHFFGLERRALTYFYANNFFGFIPLPLLILAALVFWLPFVIITSLAAFGCTFARWTKEMACVVLLMIGYIAPHLLIIAEDRFHLALVPFLAILAAYAWMHRAEILYPHSPQARRALLGGAVLAALLFLNWGLELSRDANMLAALFGPNGNTLGLPY